MANPIIQAQAMINGKKTFFVTRPKDVIFDDKTTLADKQFGGGGGDVNEELINNLIYRYMNGIKFDEEYLFGNDIDDSVPDNFLDPELIAYIDELFSSLNDMIVNVPGYGWKYDGEYYVLTVPVEELIGTEYPIVSVIEGSNTTPDYSTDTISSCMRDISINENSITLKSTTAFNTGFKLILKGVNIQGGRIIENYNSLVEKFKDLSDRIDINDVVVKITTDGWSLSNGLYIKSIPADGILSNQNIIYCLYDSPYTDSQKNSYENINSLTTVDNGIIVSCLTKPTEDFNILLKSALVTNGTVPGTYEEVKSRLDELDKSTKVVISDKYDTYDGTASDRTVASSYALFLVYKILKAKYEDVKDVENIIFENNEGKLHVITKSGWCRIAGYITIKNSSISPLVILKDLPKPYAMEFNSSIYGSRDSIELTITLEGVMYAKYGMNGDRYPIDISYPYEEEV